MNSRKLRIPCVRSKSRRENIYQLSLTPKQLELLVRIDYMSRGDKRSVSFSKSGYQRNRKEKDIKEMAFFIMDDNNICPDAIWLNDRNKTVVFEKINKKTFNLGYIVTNNISELFCPDGQARVLGIVDAWKQLLEGGDKSMNNFVIPVVLTQTSKSKERKGFLDINDNICKVSVEQKAAVKFQSAIIDGENSLEEKDMLSALAYGVIERLDNEKNGPLYDMFILPDKLKYSIKQKRMDKIKFSKRSIKSGSFIEALSGTNPPLIKLLNEMYINEDFEIRVIKIANKLSVYWSILKNKTYPMWEIKENYAFLQAIGIRAMAILYYYLLNEYGKKINGEMIEKCLDGIQYLENYDQWMSSAGIKYFGIKNQSRINKTRAGKLGGGQAQDIAKKIINEICNKHKVKELNYQLNKNMLVNRKRKIAK